VSVEFIYRVVDGNGDLPYRSTWRHAGSRRFYETLRQAKAGARFVKGGRVQRAPVEWVEVDDTASCPTESSE
jgi:hypothetical protein